MTPESLHDLFLGAAGVAGALIGLLFVAISVEHDRIVAPDADQVQRVRAQAALTAFTNALTVSLFALIPGDSLAHATTAVGVIGVLFVASSILSVRRRSREPGGHTGGLRNLTFLVVQLVVFAFEIESGIQLITNPRALGPAETIGTLVIVSFLVGISRAWELVGGPEVGLRSEMRELVRTRGSGPPSSDEESSR